MREKLNENPKAQVGLVVVLIALAALFFLKSSGGEEEEVPTGEVAATVNGVPGSGSTPGEAVESAVESLEAGVPAESSVAAAPASVPAPPPPRELTASYDAGKTVVLLVVHDGGIDDKFATHASLLLEALPDVDLFIVPAKQIARYAAITVSLAINRTPALVVMKPKPLSGGTPQASVDYGFQTPQSVVQAVVDAKYDGREVTYHPN